MNLNEIIKNLAVIQMIGRADLEISDIIYDSRKVVPNSVFVCLTGFNSDGHEFINEAINKGAKAIVVEKEINVAGVTLILVEDTRQALAEMSANFFNHPASKLVTIGITGTKGKTTTSFMIKSILESAGFKTGVIGTLGVVIENEIIKLSNTTPESYEVQKYLRYIVDRGYKYAVMEASSIGLKTHRIDGFNFNYGIFTNFSNDHIGEGEHKDMQEYLDSKSLLFKKCDVGILNKDDENFVNIIKNHTCEIQTYGFKSDADYVASDIELTSKSGKVGTNFKVTGKANLDLKISIPGKFNVYNALAAVAVCDYMGINLKEIEEGLLKAQVRGRVEPVKVSNKFSLFIDYAHNALSLENVLETLREYNPNRLVVLFGAGGNRPKSRRYEMGEAAGKLADLSVVTTDNPRFEEPMKIIEDIKVGLKRTAGKYIVIEDRKQAIRYCIENAQPDDIIVLAGKGHEDYQDIKGVKYPMDERELIQEIIKQGE